MFWINLKKQMVCSEFENISSWLFKHIKLFPGQSQRLRALVFLQGGCGE